MADSYGSPMLGGVQRQFIDQVQFDASGPGELLVRVSARHGRIRLRPDYSGESLPQPRLQRYEIDFRLDGERFKVSPATSAAGRLFHLGVR